MNQSTKQFTIANRWQDDIGLYLKHNVVFIKQDLCRIYYVLTKQMLVEYISK